MPPLTRQPMPQSLHSEWSHSFLGATISIHALAKPLMKVMYHGAVLDLIKRQQGIPLSTETMQIYANYLGWKYVAETTKTHILGDIDDRALVEPEAQIVRGWGCWILGRLAFHASTRGAVVAAQPCARLVALLRDSNVDVVKGACYALSQISRDLDSATAVVAMGVLDFIPELLESTSVEVRRLACWILARLAFHSSTRGAVVAVQPCARLVACLRDSNVGVVEGACCALSQLSRDFDGTRAVVDVGVLDFIPELFESANAEVRRSTCWILGQLASHSSTRGAVVAVQPCARLVACLHDSNVDVVQGACYALSQLSRDFDGTRAVVDMGVLDFIPELFESANVEVRRWTCWMLGRLASHSSMRGTVVAAEPCAQTCCLSTVIFNVISEFSPFQSDFSDGNVDVVEGACYALSHISHDLDAATAVVDVGVLDFIPKLFESANVEVLRWTCWILGKLASHASTRGAIVAAQPCARLVACLRDNNVDIIESASYAISNFSRSQAGAKALMEAGILDFVAELIDSPQANLRGTEALRAAYYGYINI
ncbi:armadillo-type protein [Mycena galericulata]|nr:armadillo-type protein [Mycena galericulata]